jgi:hypothetical protein
MKSAASPETLFNIVRDIPDFGEGRMERDPGRSETDFGGNASL